MPRAAVPAGPVVDRGGRAGRSGIRPGSYFRLVRETGLLRSLNGMKMLDHAAGIVICGAALDKSVGSVP
jgi:hypothetical protein